VSILSWSHDGSARPSTTTSSNSTSPNATVPHSPGAFLASSKNSPLPNARIDVASTRTSSRYGRPDSSGPRSPLAAVVRFPPSVRASSDGRTFASPACRSKERASSRQQLIKAPSTRVAPSGR
jgi:hypothetical protein